MWAKHGRCSAEAVSREGGEGRVDSQKSSVAFWDGANIGKYMEGRNRVVHDDG